ncbi:MAG TPA: protein kinase, partial [Vicinamibacteria bacterium]|nr:protein kinase [Vicinamibacteria bacterium]
MQSKYRVLEEMGSGGMGTIHKGVLIGQSGFQRPIVIKKLKHADDPGHVKMFVDEARRYALLDHENIGRIFDFENVDGQLCIILEYIDGWSLVEFLERHRQAGRLPEVDLSVFMVSRVCRALQYVYERSAIVHRDISPSNIMMTREGAVKLIDFGIATRSGTRDSSLTGKPAYMAPEMVVELRADNRSDLFSLGTVLFEMLTGQRLFTGKTTTEVLEQVITGQHPSPRTFNPDIPDAVMAILRTALQRDPARRYASAAEMGAACEHFLYDKGYGPTNLTLKEYLTELFPEKAAGAAESNEPFPEVEPTLLPIYDTLVKPPDLDKTPPRRHAYTVARPPAPPADGAVPPGPDAGTLPPTTLAPSRPRR